MCALGSAQQVCGFAQCRHFEKWRVIGLIRFLLDSWVLCQVQKGYPFVCLPPACGFIVSPTGSDVTMRRGAPALCPGAPCHLLPPPHGPCSSHLVSSLPPHLDTPQAHPLSGPSFLPTCPWLLLSSVHSLLVSVQGSASP